MNKYTIASIMFFLSLPSFSAEWIAVGEQPELSKTDEIEIRLWEYLKENSESDFEPSENYRFQYKFISESKIFINALCVQALNDESELGALPGPTTEKLKNELYLVLDGGNCFFNVKYNIEKAKFYSLSINDRG
ncbi:hypothetical protein [Teredinibacter sp. KSP-S5-2]|uniref:hypothetical protein n=1 Tax=Teredinibacter sp. KSP-S5-2 TaxID=3034506 RepID=UPI00293413A7|nr:hypothetical protein [Teredinibacter sp. KSP-S5-2]WNO10067.1 hypothetical protein P5V12_02665 [Teredinibacter sp. KSP-S5-2]